MMSVVLTVAPAIVKEARVGSCLTKPVLRLASAACDWERLIRGFVDMMTLHWFRETESTSAEHHAPLRCPLLLTECSRPLSRKKNEVFFGRIVFPLRHKELGLGGPANCLAPSPSQSFSRPNRDRQTTEVWSPADPRPLGTPRGLHPDQTPDGSPADPRPLGTPRGLHPDQARDGSPADPRPLGTPRGLHPDQTEDRWRLNSDRVPIPSRFLGHSRWFAPRSDEALSACRSGSRPQPIENGWQLDPVRTAAD